LSKMLRVLMVEDSATDASLILRELSRQGYEPLCQQVETAQAMFAALEKQPWDIVISDYVLPSFSGLEALRILMETKLDIPCIVTSGRVSEETAVAAMKAGARDYVMKDNLKRLGPAVDRELAEAEERRQRRKAQEALRQNETKLSVVLEQMPCILWTTDTNLNLTSLMGAGLKAFKFDPSNYIGKPMTEILEITGHVIAAQRQALEEIPTTFEIAVGGQALYCFVQPLLDADGSVTGVIGLALDVTDKKHAEIELRSLSHKLVASQENERRNIARELHDQIGQSLTVLKLMIGQAGRSTPEKVGPVLGEALGVVSELIQQVREMSLKLRPSMLDDLGLLPTLLWHFEKFSKQSGVRINFVHDGLERTLTPEINTAAYRIVQEALTNIARYAGVNEANILVRADEKALYIEIEDRGSGFDRAKLAANTSTGISGMRERVHLLGGKLDIETHPGKGTCLTVQIPLQPTVN
jgi:two-component system sensor histidine kinase UhpB